VPAKSRSVDENRNILPREIVQIERTAKFFFPKNPSVSDWRKLLLYFANIFRNTGITRTPLSRASVFGSRRGAADFSLRVKALAAISDNFNPRSLLRDGPVNAATAQTVRAGSGSLSNIVATSSSV